MTLPDDAERELSERYLLAHHGLTPADYEQLMVQQRGLCAICWAAPAAVVDRRSASTRGLLCQRCDLALGVFAGDPRLFLRAWHYLLENP